MRTVVFDGHNMADIVVVEGVRRPMMAELVANTSTIPGMDGVVLDSTGLGTLTIYVDVRALGMTKTEMRQKLATLASWLHVDGPRRLTISDAPDRYWLVVPFGQIDVDEFIATGGCTIGFLSLSPAAYSVAKSSVPLASGAEIDVLGTYPVRPVIKATATGNVRIDFDGTQTVKVAAPSGAAVVIDCEGRFAMVNGTHKPISLDSNFVELKPGRHTVTGLSGASAASVEYQARWL